MDPTNLLNVVTDELKKVNPEAFAQVEALDGYEHVGGKSQRRTTWWISVFQPAATPGARLLLDLCGGRTAKQALAAFRDRVLPHLPRSKAA